MSGTKKDMLKVMQGWVGYSEYNGKYKEIINIYNSVSPLPRGYKVQYNDEWCDVTISAAAIKSGCVDLIGRECGCEEHVRIFKNLGIWIEDGSIVPEAGDIILYNWNQVYQPNNGYSDHIGIVENVERGYITTIEGNYNEVVQRRHIPIAWGYIRGYARPRYKNDNNPPVINHEKGKINRVPQWIGEVTADVLNVRTWAGTEYENIKSYPILKYKNRVDVCDVIKDSKGEDWYYVRIAGRYYGFVYSAYIRRV